MCADEQMLHQSSVGHKALTQGPADVPWGKNRRIGSMFHAMLSDTD